VLRLRRPEIITGQVLNITLDTQVLKIFFSHGKVLFLVKKSFLLCTEVINQISPFNKPPSSSSACMVHVWNPNMGILN